MQSCGGDALTLALSHLAAVSKGDRVAQLILERIATPDVVEARPAALLTLSDHSS
jgi:hypothetical protein